MNPNWSYSPDTLNSSRNWWFLSRVNWKFDVSHWKTIGHLCYATSSFVEYALALISFRSTAIDVERLSQGICITRFLRGWLEVSLILHNNLWCKGDSPLIAHRGEVLDSRHLHHKIFEGLVVSMVINPLLQRVAKWTLCLLISLL